MGALTVVPVPEVLDCGYCLTDQSRTVVFHCSNTGGEGSFKMMPADKKEEEEEEEEEEEVRVGSHM